MKSQPNRKYTEEFRAAAVEQVIAGSPPYPAETGSLTYGPIVRLWLLPTPPRDDAVIFSYGAVANSGRDFHPANGTPSRAYMKRSSGRLCQAATARSIL
ncbi:hypothetical protein SAMN05414139_10489 [Burkholderia sp. D7]|nr:hypothetical protein SAMN05414139_10489 [Burkholderia sp. D7]